MRIQNTSTYLLLILSLTFSYQNCSRAKFDTAHTKADVTTQRIPGTPLCVDDSFQQPSQQTGKVDILFVTDTSGSLDEERAAVANNISSFVNKLPSDVDYNIAVLLAHAEKSSTAGKLWTSGSGPAVLTKSMGLDSIRAQLRNRLVNVSEELVTDGGEAGLYALNKLLSPGHLETAQLQGFFRDDAGLAVVFISDENDICYKGLIRDSDNREIPAFNKFCSNPILNAETVLNSLNLTKNGNPLTVSAVLYIDSSRIASGSENEIGLGYLDLIAKNANGHAADMFTPSQIPQGLAEIGEKTRIALALKTTVDVSVTDLDLSSIEVFVDSQKVLFDVSPDRKKIILLEPGDADSLVEVSYCGNSI